jgi:hypothetical protein
VPVSHRKFSLSTPSHLLLELRPNFGNGGDVENLLGKAKVNFTQRHRGNRQALENIVFEAIDFDMDFDRALKADTRLSDLFKDTVGSDELVDRLRTIQQTAVTAKKRGENLADLIPTTFVFKGPPGAHFCPTMAGSSNIG